MGCASQYIESHRAEWKDEKHGAQWQATLDTYVEPVFGDLPVQNIDITLVMKVLEPIWKTKTETASRVRGRIERILDWATTAGYRQGENPARWRGHLENLLPRRSKVRKVTHHPALSYAEVGSFVTALRGVDGIAPDAFEFLILTEARTSEVLGARWDEIDLENAIWTVPASRIKAAKEHRVPLSDPAMRILKHMAEVRQDDLVFPSPTKGKPLSSMALLAVLDRMGRRKSLHTASARRSVTGRGSAPASLAKLPRWRWRIPSPARSRPPSVSLAMSRSRQPKSSGCCAAHRPARADGEVPANDPDWRRDPGSTPDWRRVPDRACVHKSHGRRFAGSFPRFRDKTAKPLHGDSVQGLLSLLSR